MKLSKYIKLNQKLFHIHISKHSFPHNKFSSIIMWAMFAYDTISALIFHNFIFVVNQWPREKTEFFCHLADRLLNEIRLVFRCYLSFYFCSNSSGSFWIFYIFFIIAVSCIIACLMQIFKLCRSLTCLGCRTLGRTCILK